MSFKDHIEEFNLKKVKDVSPSSVDLSKIEVSVSKGILYINRDTVDAMKLKKGTNLEIYTGQQAGAVVFGLKSVDKKSNSTITVNPLKTKPTKINLARLMMKNGLQTNIEHKIDLVDCDKGYLVFAIIPPAKPKEKGGMKPKPKEEPQYLGSGIVGAEEKVLPGSDF